MKTVNLKTKKSKLRKEVFQMPNWCYSTYAFKSTNANKDNLQRLHQKLAGVVMKPSGVDMDFANGWLGEVATVHGLDFEQIPCRGEITHLDALIKGGGDDCGSHFEAYDDCYFKLETETAWCPMTELCDAVIEQYEGVSYVYVAEEAGCDIFINTDIEGQFFDQRYLLEICCNMASLIPDDWSFENVVRPVASSEGSEAGLIGLDIMEYFRSFGDLQDYFTKLTGRDYETLAEMLNYLDEVIFETYGEQNSYLMANIREFTFE